MQHKIGIKRRSFLQATGLTMLFGSLGIPFDPAKAAEEANGVHFNPQMKDGWHFGHCRMCMRGTCPNLYRVENGIAVEVMGNPECPTTKGALCAKGQSIIQNTYNAYRVKAPMKRTNPNKGLDVDPQWVEISWDEALDTVADKLADIRRRDPRRFLYQVGFGDMDFFCTFMFYFAQAYGTPNFVKSNGILCTLHYASDLVQGVFPGSVPDASYCRYFIAMGLNVGMGIGSCEGGTRGIFDLMYEGDKDFQLVVVDPRCSPEASKGEWVPIKPGGDLAFLMGLINVILYEIGRVDDHFLKWRSNAPYLIGPDGHYFRGKDGKPQIKDLADGKIKSFDDKTLKDPDFWDTGRVIYVTDVFASRVLVKAGFKNSTPEWAETICDVPAKRIRKIAQEYINNARIGETIKLQNSKGEWVEMPVRGSMIEAKRGIKNQRDGEQCDLMCKLMAMLIGGIDVPGGTVAKSRSPIHLKPDADGVVEPKGEARDNPMSYPPKHINLSDYFPHKHTLPILAYKVAQDPRKYGFDYELEASLTVGSNPISSTAEPYEILKGVLNIPFQVNIAYHYDEMAQLADILLASNSVLERESVNCFEGAFDLSTIETNNKRLMMYRDPLPPIYNTRQPQDIIIELCERMGMLDDFNANLNKVGVVLGELTTAELPPEEQLKPGRRYTISEIWDKGVRAQFGGRGLDYMKKHGLIIEERAPAEAYNSYWYKDGETRCPVYF
ncbi:MAG: molybdopterin-dependent oxidoreductase, partial [Burkholderiales bacterium]|nr:molybdopterin-dependent oxidoreductase [Burkholderiales bacterium]